MISFISFIIVLIGSFNWLSIGMLQYDFIAGLFGSQANLFSRVVYAIIGLASIWLIYTTIKQKGKIFVSPKNNKDAKIIGDIKNMVSKNKNSDNDKKPEDTKKTEHENNNKNNNNNQHTQNYKNVNTHNNNTQNNNNHNNNNHNNNTKNDINNE